MAVIGKIQKNSLLLLIVIGLAMLAFIFTDFFRNQDGDVERLDTAILNGEPINVEEYEELREQYVERSKNQMAYQQQEWTDEAQAQAENDAFNEHVRRTLLGEEFEKLGIKTTANELNDMIHGNHVHPWIKQIPIFNGPTGFSKDSVRNYLNTLEIEPVGATEEQLQGWKDSRKQWKEFETELKDARKADKYVSLVSNAMFVNKLEAQDQYNSNYESKKVRFVMQRFVDIPLEEVTVSEEEVKAYYEEHKNDLEYEQSEARDIRFVSFPVNPSAADKQRLNDEMEELRKEFAETENNVLFAYQNSESQFYSDSSVFQAGESNYLSYKNPNRLTYPAGADDAIQNAEKGDVIGPFETDLGELALVKVVDNPTEKRAWVRHILISTGATRTDERAKEIADSVITEIKKNDNFAELVPIVSEDPGSKDKGGEYKWFPEGMMVPEFNDASFNGPIGKLQLVKTDYGYHIVEVLGQADRVTPVLAVVAKKLEIGEETLRNAEERAYDYIFSVSQYEGDSAFSKVAMDSGRQVQTTRVYLENNYVLGMKEPENMYRFLFSSTTKEGDISDPIADENNYFIAIVDNVVEEGTPEFEDVKGVMETPALREKQAELYVQKMSGMNSLQEVGESLENAGVMQAEVRFSEGKIIAGGVPEPYVVGKLFTNIGEGKMTTPIVGEQGIYVFMVESVSKAPETTDLNIVAEPMRVARIGRADNAVIQALREKADLVDNRRRIKFQ